MKRSRRRRVLWLTVVGIPTLFLLTLVVYLAFGDLGRHRGIVEDLVTRAIGRQLRIEGRFEPFLLSLSPTVRAENVWLANPDWSTEPYMVHIDRLEGSVDLMSVFSGTVRIHDVRVDGARVRLEIDGTGGASWDFDVPSSGGPRPAGETATSPVVFERAVLRDVEFSFGNLSTGSGIELHLDQAGLDPTDGGRYRVTIDGRVLGTPFDLEGEYGPVEPFILFRQADYALSGHLQEIRFEIEGRMSNLQRLEDCDSRVEIRGPDIAQLTTTFGLPSLGDGPFELSATTSPGSDGTTVDVQSRLGEVEASARGRMGTLTSIDDIELDVEGQGPDLRAFGALFGVRDLPADPFSASGRVIRRAGETRFDAVEASIGDERLSIDGVIGQPPHLFGTDVEVTASGDDLAELSGLAGMRLPGGAYRVEGRVVREEHAIELHDVRARLDDNKLSAHGRVTDAPHYESSDLRLEARGPDLSVFSSFAGVDLPAESFEVDGTIKGGKDRFELESIHAALGETELRLRGSTRSITRLDGVDVHASVAGPDLGSTLALAGIEKLPSDPFEVDGRVRVSGKDFELTGVTALVGGVSARIDGTVAGADDLIGTDVAASVSGESLSTMGRLLSYETLPDDPFRITGRLRVDSTGYRLQGVEAEVGGLAVSADGTIGRDPGLDGSDLVIEARGDRLSELEGFGDLPELPDASFRIAGRLQVEAGSYHLERVRGSIDANRIEADGWLGPFPDLGKTELSLELGGPDLSDAATLVEEVAQIELPGLPAKTFRVSGQVRVVEGGYELGRVEAELGESRLTGSGRVGAVPGFHGTDVAFQASGPEASMIGAILGLDLPAESFRIAGRAEWNEEGARFHDVRADIGPRSARIDGTLGRPPRLVGTNLDLSAEGPEPVVIRQLARMPWLPAEPWFIDAHFDGTPERFTLSDLRAGFGDSDLQGELSVDLREKPRIQGRFTADEIDLAPLIPPKLDPHEAQAATEATPPEQPADEPKDVSQAKEAPDPEGRKKKRRLISDDPFEFQKLGDQDVEVELSVATISSHRTTIEDLELRISLVDGRLRAERFSAKGSRGARFEGFLDLQPVGESYRFESRLELSGARLEVLGYGDDHHLWPPHDLQLEVSGEGRSPRELAASLDGLLSWEIGSGRVNNSALDLLVFDLLLEILEILNPFRKNDPFTELECAVIVAQFDDGVTTLEPLAMRTDKTTIVGHGEVDLNTEKLDLDWAAKPRKGLGMSANAITNPYIKVGGVMADPALEVKPLQAVTTTGVAVATAGLSLLARGMYDRITAEKKVCKHAKKELQEIRAERESSAGQ